MPTDRQVDHDMNIQSFRQRIRTLLKIFTSNVNVESSFYQSKDMFRTVTDTVNIQSFRQRLRIIIKMINEISTISSSDDRFLGFIKIISSTININHTPSIIKHMIKTVSHAVHNNIRKCINRKSNYKYIILVIQT